MDFAKSLLQPLSSSAVGSGVLDATKLVILGGTVETARRAASSGWNSFVSSFYLTAHFCEDDYPYDWLLNWLSKQPAWSRSREFEATTSTVTATGRSSQRTAGDEVEEDIEDVIEEDDGRPRLKVHFQPTLDTTHTIYYKGHLLRIRRSKKTDGSELSMLTISVVARSNAILKQLVLQAKREYEQECVDRVQIYFADQHGSWRWSDSRHKRPLSSIVLNPGVIEMLVADAKDFLRSERWYASRGIPYRRGYLLHGTPGAGKSSLIHALAGELALDVYIVSLSASWINDASLTSLLGRIPARSILLLEDIDAAFTRSTSRDKEPTGAPSATKETKDAAGPETKKEAEKDDSKLSLSGLLNALDGMQASEARLLFCTTNHLERLDPALSRPGRMDVWIEFRNASKFQAEGLFRNFFPVAEEFEAESTPSSSLFSSYNSSTAATPPTAPTTPAPSTPSTSATPSADAAPQSLKDALPTLESASSLGTTLLDAARLSELAKAFAEAVPNEEFSVAELQGFLLKHKSRPEEAVRQVGQWVIKERELRERLAREREEKEEKERVAKEKRRKEREEKARKEKEEAEEKARKEREEKEKKEKEEAEEKARKEAAEKEKVSPPASSESEAAAAKPKDD